jgi:hypothetical protein
MGHTTDTKTGQKKTIKLLLGAPVGSTPAIANLVLALHPQILGRSEELRETRAP